MRSPSQAKDKISKTEQAEESNYGSEKSASNSPVHDGNLVIDAQETAPCSTPASQLHVQASVPATISLMDMSRETNGIDYSDKSSAQALNVSYATFSSSPLVTTSQAVKMFPSQAIAKPLVNTLHSANSTSSNGSLPRHIPVVQVRREPLLRRGNSDSKIVVKQPRTLLKNSSLKPTVTTTTTATVLSGMEGASQEEKRSSPGSKEMLAANVLAERFT